MVQPGQTRTKGCPDSSDLLHLVYRTSLRMAMPWHAPCGRWLGARGAQRGHAGRACSHDPFAATLVRVLQKLRLKLAMLVLQRALSTCLESDTLILDARRVCVFKTHHCTKRSSCNSTSPALSIDT